MNEILAIRNQCERHSRLEHFKHINFLKEELMEATGEYREEIMEELEYHRNKYYDSIGK